MEIGKRKEELGKKIEERERARDQKVRR